MKVKHSNSCSFICLFRSSTVAKPWLHLHSSFLCSLTHIITTSSMSKRTHRLLSINLPLCFTGLPELDMSTLLCSPVAILHPNPRADLPASTKYFSSLITCDSTCHLLLATGPICSCGSTMHSNADLQLLPPGISGPWEACCAPVMLVLIYLVMWGLLCSRGTESSISCLPSCLMLTSVSRGERRVGRWGERILGLNPFSARLISSEADGGENG